MERIESVNNKIIKFTNSLKVKKFRKQEGLFIAEGERLVLDAIKYAEPSYIIVSENFYKKDFPYTTYEVTESIFKKLSETVSPQGIMAVFKTDIKNIKDITPSNTVILNRLQDPGNLGTILRTAKATGFSNIILDSECADIYNSKTVRSSMSALFNLNIFLSSSLKDDISFLKNKGFTVVGTTLQSDSVNLYKGEYEFPVAFIIGNEASGMDKDLIDLCDKKVIIPMEDGIESLNASVAGSVVMYEILRRQKYENRQY